MENAFKIEIDVDGEQMIFDARLDTIGFVHKIYINVSGVDVAFEPDEERSYRAIVKPAQISNLTEKDKHIISAIGAELGRISPE
jgi:hypothetical protein